MIALWGDNLFKLAPVVGRALAEAALTGTRPEVLDTVGHPQGSRWRSAA